MFQLLYLNNTGHRATYIEKKPRRFYLLLPDGTYQIRHWTYADVSTYSPMYKFKYKGRMLWGHMAYDCDQKDGLDVFEISKILEYPINKRG